MTSDTNYRLLSPRRRLQGAGDAEALSNIVVDPIPDGAHCFVLSEQQLYYLDKQSGAPVAPPVVIAATSGSYPDARWIQSNPGPRELPWEDVRDYGAVGDGVADDTGAIQAAAAQALAASKHIYFPVGSYRITTSLSIGCPVELSPGASVVPDGTETFTAPSVTGNASARSVIVCPPMRVLAVATEPGWYDYAYVKMPSVSGPLYLRARGFVSAAGLVLTVRIVDAQTRELVAGSAITTSSLSEVTISTLNISPLVNPYNDYVIQAQCVGGVGNNEANYARLAAGILL